MQHIKGKIVFYNKKSRFGFIKNYGDEQNYYVHAKNLLDIIEQEDEVEFALQEAKRGQEAILVKKVKP